MLMVDMAHFAGLVAAGLHPSPGPALRLRHHHDAQDAARPARRPDPVPRGVSAKALNSSVFPGNQGGPLMHVIAAKAVAFARGAAARRSTPTSGRSSRTRRRSPTASCGAGFRLCSGGTDNHLMLIDLRGTEITGKVAEETLDQARITVNKNTIPFDPRPPFVTSGIRIGTPAVTTRGMREPEMDADRRADAHARCGHVGDDAARCARSRDEVRALCARASRSTATSARLELGARCAAPSAATSTTGSSTRGSARKATSSAGAASASAAGGASPPTSGSNVALPRGREEGRPARAVRPRTRSSPACSARARSGRCSTDTIEAVADRIERQLQERGEREVASRVDRRGGHARAARARRGRLRPLRVGVPLVRGRRRVHGRARGPDRASAAREPRRAPGEAARRAERDDRGRRVRDASDGRRFMRARARAGGARPRAHESRTRRSARWWCAAVASSARASTRAPAGRTPRSRRCARPARARAAPTLYVTLEPCTHHGRTPPCARRAARPRAARVVVGAVDPEPAGARAGHPRGCAAPASRSTVGVEAAAAGELVAGFRIARAPRPPARDAQARRVTLDGRIATARRRLALDHGRRARAASGTRCATCRTPSWSARHGARRRSARSPAGVARRPRSGARRGRGTPPAICRARARVLAPRRPADAGSSRRRARRPRAAARSGRRRGRGAAAARPRRARAVRARRRRRSARAASPRVLVEGGGDGGGGGAARRRRRSRASCSRAARCSAATACRPSGALGIASRARRAPPHVRSPSPASAPTSWSRRGRGGCDTLCLAPSRAVACRRCRTRIERAELADRLRAGGLVLRGRRAPPSRPRPSWSARRRASTPEAINFMATHGRGLVCLALTRERMRRLGIPLMASERSARLPAYGASIEARRGVSTGISASRSRDDDPGGGRAGATSGRPRDAGTRHADPGHRRAAASCARRCPRRRAISCRLAGLGRRGGALRGARPRRQPRQRRRSSTALAREHHAAASSRSTDVHPDAAALRHAGAAARRGRAAGARAAPTSAPSSTTTASISTQHMALVLGELRGDGEVLVRVHSQCLTGDVFGSRALRLRRAARSRRCS